MATLAVAMFYPVAMHCSLKVSVFCFLIDCSSEGIFHMEMPF